MTESKAKTIVPVKREGHWFFDGVKPMRLQMPSGDMALAVFASKNLPKGTRFEYFGTPLTKKEFDKLLEAEKKKQTPHRLAYIVQAKADLYLDAYHERQFGVGHRGLYLAGCINEPEKAKDANCKLVISHKGGTHAWVVTQSDIEEGAELTMNYGGRYKRAGYSKS